MVLVIILSMSKFAVILSEPNIDKKLLKHLLIQELEKLLLILCRL